MSYLSPGELQQFRNDIAPLLTGTAVIVRPSEVSDSQGGYDRIWTAIGTAPCRIEPIMRMSLGTEESGGTMPQSTKGFFVIFPSDQDVRAIDKVQSLGQEYEVLGVRQPRTDEITTRCECEILGIGGPASAS